MAGFRYGMVFLMRKTGFGNLLGKCLAMYLVWLRTSYIRPDSDISSAEHSRTAIMRSKPSIYKEEALEGTVMPCAPRVVQLCAVKHTAVLKPLYCGYSCAYGKIGPI